MFGRRAPLRLDSLLLLATAGLLACAAPPVAARRETVKPADSCEKPAPAPVASAASADASDGHAANADRAEAIDFGDGSTNVLWNAPKRTLIVESLPPILVDEGEKLDCLHVTGLAGVHDDAPPVLVVLSLLFGPHTCGTMLGRSIVYRFDGRAWTKAAITVGSELHLRPDGPDVVEWKLVSAEVTYDPSSWSKVARKKFPPPEPRATDLRPFGFAKPDAFSN